MLGWVGTLINSWSDRERFVHPAERRARCGRGRPVQRSSALLSPAVMFSSRKTWDLGHAPCLQELWKKDISLDGESDTLQDKVCEFQARLRSEEIARHLLVQQLQQQSVTEKTSGVQTLQEEQLAASGEGATDLEKQLELLEVENERLKEELKSCRSSELQNRDTAAGSCSCSQDAEALRREVSRWESQARQRERRLAELERELLEKTAKLETLQTQLDESTRQLDESRHRQSDAEHTLTLRLQECEEELARQAATPPRVKYVTQTVEVESTDSQKALADVQMKNGALQEQLAVQRQLLRELETQLHESQRTCTQLRTQILVYEGEMERAQGQLEAEMQNLEEEKNRVIEEAFVRAESEMKAVHENLAGVRMNLLSLQPALRTLTCDYNCLKRQVQEFPFMLDKAITEAKQEICQVISEVSSTNQELLRKYKREMNLRKKCHNELVRLKGNIRVFCRVRPVSQEEQDSADAKTMLSFDSDDDAILYLSNKGKVMTFELDKVFPPQATQEEVFQEVQSLVTSCIDGFNICIFAYGQTGSGKTYTMEGVVDDPGINQRALRLLFSEVTEKAPDWDYKITVSMVEIYNETLRNLLGENPTDKLDIKMNPDGSGQLYVPGLTEFTVQSPEDINRLNLVDLAGSERIGKSGAEGSRLREAQCINKSLSALGDVINALRSKHSHIPFRNSRLTYLLQDSLSGDSKTLMMVQVSPLPNNMSESVCSLKFAQRVRSVELNSTSSSSRRHENSSTSSSPTHDSVEQDVNKDEFRAILAEAGGKLVVVDFMATWCGSCRCIAPEFIKQSEDPENKNVIFLKVDVDEVEDVSSSCGIKCMPTFQFYKNGQKVTTPEILQDDVSISSRGRKDAEPRGNIKGTV
ncbi:hypothetical protein PAMP_000038 [Pampus punctatissimus]